MILVSLVIGVLFVSGCVQQKPETRIEWLQTGNTLHITQLQPKQSRELADNRIGQMASLEADIHTEQDADGFVYQNIDLGMKWVRLSVDYFDWDEVKSTGLYSEYNIDPNHDRAITGLVDNDIKITYTLVYWDEKDEEIQNELGEEYTRFKTEEEIQRYLDYVRFVIHHFKGRIEYYEILNEPISGSGTLQSVKVDDYINLVKRVVPVIREEDPGAKVAVGAIPNLYEPADYDYLISILNSDIMSMVDAISFHPMHGVSPDYELKEFYYEYPSVIQEIKAVASANGFKGEYIADELVWRTAKNPLPSEPWIYSEIVAAKYYARGIVSSLGMNLTTGLALEALEDFPLMVSVIRNLCTIMAGAEPISLPIEIQSEATNIQNYSFSLHNGDKLVALWTDGVAVDDDPGIEATLTLPGFSAQKVIGIDVLNSFEQQMVTNVEDGNLVIRNLLVKDYPIILRLTP